MFGGAAAFNQDLSGWDVGNGRSFVSTRRIRLVCCDVYYKSQVLYYIIYNSTRRRLVCLVGQLHLIRI